MFQKKQDKSDTENWSKYILSYLGRFGKIFSKKKSERIPTRKPWDHGIEFVENYTLPKKSSHYPLLPQEKEALNKWLEEELRKRYIRRSKSQIAASVFFVKKKDRSLQLIQDYQKLNDITKKN